MTLFVFLRWLLNVVKPLEKNEKNLVIIGLALSTLAALAFGFYQKQQADKLEALGIENEQKARDILLRAQEAEVNAMRMRELERLHAVQLQKAYDSMQRLRSAAEAKLAKSRAK